MLFKDRLVGLFLFIFILLISNLAGAGQYHLHADDRLSISVWGHDDLQQTAVVDPDGKISFPLIGSLQAEGLTIEELTELLQIKLSKYIKNPLININLQSYYQLNIMVMGAVKDPGTFRLKEGKRVIDVLSLSGGATEQAELSAVKLTRGGQSFSLNLEKVLSGETTADNYLLNDGDVIFIPESTIEVTIFGQVRQPGRYHLEKGLELTDLIALAGGFTEMAGQQLEYQTERQIEQYNIQEILAGSQEKPRLKDGDTVYIPKANDQVFIQGEVNRPGSYPWQEGLKLAGLLAEAGNQTSYGDIARVKIVTADSRQEIINLNSYFDDGAETNNPSLQPGDTVYIPKGDLEVTVLGEVNRPGTYLWHRELELSELLARAGNEKERGDLERVRIIRPDGTTAEVNLQSYFEDGTGSNPLLQPGDTVRIKEEKGINWPQVFSFVAGFKLIKDFLEIDW